MISFVGAGPGAPDLITVRGAARLAAAAVVIRAGSLVPEAVLEHCRPGAEIHDSATMTLEDVLAVYAAHDEATPIVRLHSGDPSIYGAIAEQMDWCRAEGRSFEVVPGVSSVGAAAAALGRELTVPGVSQSVVLTRLAGRTAASMPAGPAGEGVAAFAPHGATLAVFLSAARPDELAAELLTPGSGYGPDTPAAVVVRASWPDETVVRTTVGRLAEDLRATGATMTALVLVGDVLAEEPVRRRSHLYEPAYTTAYRLRSAAGSTEGRPSARRSDR
ncbi:MAG TPA: precorrin-4 C(11)-methyltransferase [Acidimicrobiia bacterium]|nr:precorrin-4 C(11)-methyltransferase [Acidimicrobiia bacterium]